MQTERAVARDIDEYIAGFPDEVRTKLEQIRKTIRKAAPGAEERITYQIPTFVLNGHLVYFAGFRKHISFYPAPRGNPAFQDELATYKGGKGTIHLPLDQPIPFDLITRIVKFRVVENEKLAEAKRQKKGGKAR